MLRFVETLGLDVSTIQYPAFSKEMLQGQIRCQLGFRTLDCTLVSTETVCSLQCVSLSNLFTLLTILC